MKKINIVIAVSLFTMFACSKKVPVSECKTVVAHAKKIMGNDAPSASKLMEDCKAATDEQRGCAMDAKNSLSLAACLK